MQMSIRLSEAGFESDARELLAIISGFPDAEGKLAGYADEVKAGRVRQDKNQDSAQEHGNSRSA